MEDPRRRGFLLHAAQLRFILAPASPAKFSRSRTSRTPGWPSPKRSLANQQALAAAFAKAAALDAPYAGMATTKRQLRISWIRRRAQEFHGAAGQLPSNRKPQSARFVTCSAAP